MTQLGTASLDFEHQYRFSLVSTSWMRRHPRPAPATRSRLCGLQIRRQSTGRVRDRLLVVAQGTRPHGASASTGRRRRSSAGAGRRRARGLRWTATPSRLGSDFSGKARLSAPSGWVCIWTAEHAGVPGAWPRSSIGDPASLPPPPGSLRHDLQREARRASTGTRPRRCTVQSSTSRLSPTCVPTLRLARRFTPPSWRGVAECALHRRRRAGGTSDPSAGDFRRAGGGVRCVESRLALALVVWKAHGRLADGKAVGYATIARSAHQHRVDGSVTTIGLRDD